MISCLLIISKIFYDNTVHVTRKIQNSKPYRLFHFNRDHHHMFFVLKQSMKSHFDEFKVFEGV